MKNGVAVPLLDDLAAMQRSNSIVLVHGGGPAVTDMAERIGLAQRFIVSPEGFRSRYTDKETISLFTMVMAGKINKEIVRLLQARGLPAIGLSGIDGRLLSARRKQTLVAVDERGRRRAIEGGYTGRIESVNAELLLLLLQSGYLPVIAPVAIGAEGEALNVDSDRAAAHVAGALRAEKLIFLSDVDGIILDGDPLRQLTATSARALLAKAGHGMITKIYAALEALDLGVREVIIASGVADAPLSSALSGKAGTVIRPD